MSIDLGNRIISPSGQVRFKPSGLEALLYQGVGFDRIMAEPSDDVAEFITANRRLDSGYAEPSTDDSTADVDTAWTTPEPWATMDVVQLCTDRCKTTAELARCAYELEQFESRGMIPVLRHIAYMPSCFNWFGP